MSGTANGSRVLGEEIGSLSLCDGHAKASAAQIRGIGKSVMRAVSNPVRVASPGPSLAHGGLGRSYNAPEPVSNQVATAFATQLDSTGRNGAV